MAGGQPISLQNLREVREWCDRHGISLVHDMTRVAENAFFIQQREEGYADKSIRQIIYEICDLTDIATQSSKKDALVNIGGFLAMNDPGLYEKACALVVVFEGLHTYGGMAGRDMEALAIGITESVQDDHIRARVGQVEYLGRLLIDAEVPVVRPIGGHAVFLNARKILPHLPQHQFPAQALAAALYVESGVRSMERGAVSAGRDNRTGENLLPALELVRLTIPRRVYSQAHMDVTAESVIKVVQYAAEIQGLRFTYEPEMLRFFQARFEPIAQDTNR
jgi:tyrosine phenol-lyase